MLSSIFVLDVLRREGQEESSFTKQTKEQKVRKHLPLNKINRRLSRSGWLLLRNNFLPEFLFKFPAWNGKSFFSSRGLYLITLALGKSMGRGTKGRRVTPNRLLMVSVGRHLVKFHRHLKHHAMLNGGRRGASPRLQSLKMRKHWRGENFWLGENCCFQSLFFFFKWTTCYFVGGTEKKMRKKDFFGTGCLRHFCHDMLMNFANCIQIRVTETSALRIQEAKTAIAVQLEDREGVARTASFTNKNQ